MESYHKAYLIGVSIFCACAALIAVFAIICHYKIYESMAKNGYRQQQCLGYGALWVK